MTGTAYTSYVICTSPRSGSTLLCQLLRATECAGHPDSHFHTPSLSDWLQTYGLEAHDFVTTQDALRGVFEAAILRGRAQSSVFGLRMQRGSFDFFSQQLALLYPNAQGDAARIEAAFGPTLFIHLTRENKLEQAISHVIATQTGLWHRAADGSELERLSAPRAPRFDAEAIAHHVAESDAFERDWHAWFAREDLRPLTISYEELSRAPQNVLAIVLKTLGLDDNIADHIEPPTAKLANEVNSRWAARYLERHTPNVDMK